MKLVLFQSGADTHPRPGLLTGRGVVDISGHVARSYTPQLTMQGIIDNFEQLRSSLHELEYWAEPRPLNSVRLCPPLPRPGCLVSYTLRRSNAGRLDAGPRSSTCTFQPSFSAS